MVKNVFIDWKPKVHKDYNWSRPPKFEGQFGMPVIVDKILGNLFSVVSIKNIMILW